MRPNRIYGKSYRFTRGEVRESEALELVDRGWKITERRQGRNRSTRRDAKQAAARFRKGEAAAFDVMLTVEYDMRPFA